MLICKSAAEIHRRMHHIRVCVKFGKLRITSTSRAHVTLTTRLSHYQKLGRLSQHIQPFDPLSTLALWRLCFPFLPSLHIPLPSCLSPSRRALICNILTTNPARSPEGILRLVQEASLRYLGTRGEDSCGFG